MLHHARNLTALAAWATLGIACATPQYTVLNATAPAAGGTNQATAWPDLSTASAGDAASKNVAVIVAIEDYAFLPDVPGAVENANAWESYLRTSKGFSDVFVLTDKQAPIEEIKRFTEQAIAAAPEGGQLWFVFIGHGAALKDGTDGALIGMDAQQTIESIGSRSLARKELLGMLGQGKQAQTVVVLDTCFSGRDAGGELLAQGTQPVIPVNAAPQLTVGTVVLSAAGNDEVAGQLPGAERPAFSYLLLGALRGWADDGDGNVTADEAVNWARQQLRHVKGRQQTPAADGDKGLTLASNVSETDPGIAALMKGGGTAAASGSAALTGGSRIDTNEGVVFTKPDDWGVGPVGMGTIINVVSQYSGNAIVVSRQKMNQAYASGALGLPAIMDSAQLEVIREPETVEYGPNKGQESEYRVVDTDPNFTIAPQHHVKFGTYRNGAAWTVQLVVVDEKAQDADYAVFKAFVEGLEFK